MAKLGGNLVKCGALAQWLKPLTKMVEAGGSIPHDLGIFICLLVVYIYIVYICFNITPTQTFVSSMGAMV
jgi:hypothetical protein